MMRKLPDGVVVLVVKWLQLNRYEYCEFGDARITSKGGDI